MLVPNCSSLLARRVRKEVVTVNAPRVPLNFFGMPFGLAGLGVTWQTMAGYGRVPPAVGDIVLAAAAVAWLIVLAGYLRYILSVRPALVRDLLDPVAAPFASLALITPMLLAAEGLYPHAPAAGRVLFDVFLVLTVLLGGWFTGQWIYRPVSLDTFHPGYFLPTVAGGLIASAGAADVGQRRLAEVMLGLGVICWLVLGSIILARLLFRPLPPDPLLPTLAIEVAPAAVASLAYFALDGGRVDTVAAFLGGYGLLMALAQVRLLPAYARLPFMPSTWAFTFSWAAVATTVTYWLNDIRPGGYRVGEYLVLAAVSALIGGIAIRTLLAAGRRQLMPRPAPARRDTEFAGRNLS
jgi:tellurite resistance protein